MIRNDPLTSSGWARESRRLAPKSTKLGSKVNKNGPDKLLWGCFFAQQIDVSARKKPTCDESQIGFKWRRRVSKSVSFFGDKISQKHRKLRDILVSSQIDRKVLSDRLSDYLSALSDQGISSS
jgi:hypothetical protein